MQKFKNSLLTNGQAEDALDAAIAQVRMNLPFYTDHCQNHSSVGGIYPACENTQWTCGFWPGEVWLAWERTHDGAFLETARKLVQSFCYRIEHKIDVDHHDMGFLYTPSCVAAWKLTGDEAAKRAAILAADQLLTRFQEKGQFFQAWGKFGEPGNYRYIIDCLMNLPLLYWASEVTGETQYQEAARRHITTCMRYSFRADGSTYHTFFMNPDGTPNRGETCQGYRDDSFWARGQAWGIYGSVLSYRYDPRPEYLEIFRRALDFYLSKLPEDMVPYWDMVFTDGSGEPRDSSSAAIVACGLLESRKYLPEEDAKACEKLARQMLGSLTEKYTAGGSARALQPGAGLLLHGTYSKKSPYNTCAEEGVDEYTSWGDYFYMEALTRLGGEWETYW